MGVPDQHGLAASGGCRGQELVQWWGADHGGLINHHQVQMPECEAAILERVEDFDDGVSRVAGAFAHGDVDRPPEAR